MSDESPLARKLGYGLLIVWALFFTLGAMGELFGIEALQEATDLKRVLLR